MAEHGLSAEPTHSRWNAALPPRLTVEAGDTVHFECQDSSGAQVFPGMTVDEFQGIDRGKIHALTGPVAVHGAMPGDVLEVKVVEGGGGGDCGQDASASAGLWDYGGEPRLWGLRAAGEAGAADGRVVEWSGGECDGGVGVGGDWDGHGWVGAGAGGAVRAGGVSGVVDAG